MVNAAFKSRSDNSGPNTFSKRNFWTARISSSLIHVGILHDLEVGMKLDLHFVSGWMICNKMYQTEDQPMPCPECEKPNPRDISKPNLPRTRLCVMGYVLEDVNRKRVSKKGTEYDVNPIQVIPITLGRGKKHLENLTDASNGGLLTSEIWKFKTDDTGELVTPSPANVKYIKNLDNSGLEEVRREYAKKHTSRIQSEILSAFTNVKYEHPALVQQGIVPIDLLQEEQQEPSLDD